MRKMLNMLRNTTVTSKLDQLSLLVQIHKMFVMMILKYQKI